MKSFRTPAKNSDDVLGKGQPFPGSCIVAPSYLNIRGKGSLSLPQSDPDPKHQTSHPCGICKIVTDNPQGQGHLSALDIQLLSVL